MVIYIGIMTAVLATVCRQPAAAVGAVLCTYGLEQWSQSQSSFFWMHQTLTNFVTAAVLIVAIALRVPRGKSLFAPITREYWAMVGIYLWALMSITWSIIPDESWNQFAKEFKYSFVFGFLLPLAISDRHDLKVTLYTLLTMGFGLSLMLLMSANWQGRGIAFQTGAGIGGVGMGEGNPLAIATLGGQVALAAMLMNFRGVAKFWSIFRYAIIGVGFALAVKSGSRGQAVAVVIAALAFLPYSRRFKDLSSFLSFALTMVFVGGVLLLVFEQLTRGVAVIGQSDSTDRWSWAGFMEAYSDGRINTSLRLLGAWLVAGPHRWLVGLGSSGSFDPDIIGFYPHVVFVEVLGELGLIGWLLLWLVPIYATQNLKELWRYVKDDPQERGMIATVGGLLLFDIVLSFKQGSLLGQGSTFGLACILGRLTYAYRREIAEYEQLDAGGYPLSDTDRAYEFEDADESDLPQPISPSPAHA